jgi:flagellar hook-associated protein 1 FlgK
MADLLSTAVSALSAYSRGLETTSHNIANVATDGYSRQRVLYGTRQAQAHGNGWIGTGVNATSIERVYDQFLGLQYRITTSAFGRQDVYAALAARVSTLFADADAGFGASLQRFVNAVQDVAATPTSIPARQVLLAEATALAGELRTQDERLERLAAEVNGRVTATVSDINGIAASVADLNERIVSDQARTGQPPNDLLDERDRLVNQLSGRVAVSTVAQDDGAINVFIGSGQPLVLGPQALRLAAQRDAYDAASVRVGVETATGFIDVTASLSGGELGGLLDVRRQALDPARRTLGQLAVGITEVVNAQQNAGMTLSGAAGSDMFAVGRVGVLANAGNVGSATVAVARADIAQVTAADYVLEFGNTGWSLRRADTAAAVALAGSGTAVDPFRADGLEIVVGGAASVGDRFLVRSTFGAASGMQALLTDPASFAAALPVRVAAATGNQGTVSAAGLAVIDPANPALRTTATIAFTSATTYSINGGPNTAFTPGSPIEFNGWRLDLAGSPAAGDVLTVSSNTAGLGDNRNALALSDALSSRSLNGGTESLADLFGRLVSDVGVQTRQAQLSRDALALVQGDARAAIDSVSGVNLDEEAANLVRLQQAYQAAAQVVRVADSLFDSLLGAIGR